MRASILGLLVVCPLLLSACEDDYDASKECGRLGTCCWSDGTCNSGYTCNKSKKPASSDESGCYPPKANPCVGVCEATPDKGALPPDSLVADGPGKTDSAKTDAHKVDGPKSDVSKKDGP